MTLSVHQFPVLQDNYAYLVRDEASGQVASIDSPDGAAILAEAQKLGWAITMVLNTHWHPDHAGGNAAIAAATGARLIGPAEVRDHFPLDEVLGGGDRIALGATTFDVFDTGGHTKGHISYYSAPDALVFVGDTLFAMGCGRMFEGTPPQFWASLSRLASLPDDTRVYCAHEYSAANARFALSIDQSAATRQRAEAIFAATQAGKPTVPSLMGEEKATNPFLRAPILGAIAGESPEAAFARVRLAKDQFRG